MNNKINIIGIFTYYVVIVLLSLCVIASMRFYINQTASGVSTIALLVISLIVILLLFLGKVSIRSHSILSIALCFSLLTLFFRIGDLVSLGYNDKIRLVLSVFSIPIGICCGLYFNRFISGNNRMNRWNRIVLVVPLIIGLYYYFNSYEIAPDGIFILVVLLPLVTLLDSDVAKVALFLVVGVCVTISAKRSIAIAYVIIIAMLGFHYLSIIKNGQAKRVFQAILILLSTALVLLFIVSSNNSSFNNVLNRFQDLEGTGGNGRTGIYMAIIDQYTDSTPLEKAFGHGYNAVTDTLFGHPAHNDILEVLYDYGYISTILYCILILKILLLFLKRDSFKPRFSFDWLMLGIIVVLIFFVSMLNCIISSSLYELMIYFGLGVVLQRINISDNCK